MYETGPERPPLCLPELDDIEQRCWRQFLASSTGLLATMNSRLLDAHDLTLFEVRLLDFLDKSDGGSARMSDLATAFVLTRSRMTWQIRRLEAQGLVSRDPSPDDRRGVLAKITLAGRARVRPAIKTYAQQIRLLYLNPMSRPQMIALGDSCRQINAGLDGSERPNADGRTHFT